MKILNLVMEQDTYVKTVSKEELDEIEKFADKLFSKINIDVEFTNHFLDRINDARNGKQITKPEMIRLFKQTFKQHKKHLKGLDNNAQQVINDIQTELNLPFVIKWDEKNKEFDLISKTIMRKSDFKTSNEKIIVEDK